MSERKMLHWYHQHVEPLSWEQDVTHHPHEPYLDTGWQRRRGKKHMLVLRRKAGEKIVLNGNIIVTLVAIEGRSVTVGVSAPPAVIIVREEVLGHKPTADETIIAPLPPVSPTPPPTPRRTHRRSGRQERQA